MGARIGLTAMMALGTALSSGCAAQPVSAPEVQQSTTSILVSSSPAAGSTVVSPVNELKLRFNPPARLDEVTLSGPDGVVPMMINAVGEVADYSVPLPDLGPGAYTVNWKAQAGVRDCRGSFQFTAK